jgi:prolyl 4-hydroxylase
MRFYPDFKKCTLMGLRNNWIDPKVCTIENYLTDEQCDGLISLAEPYLETSYIVDEKTGLDIPDTTWRKSQSTYLYRGSSELLEQVEDRMDGSIAGGDRGIEPLHILKYTPGGFYKAHHDWFKYPPADGQRVATLLMYLNTPEEGGELYFPNLGITIAPKKGRAVFFNYESDREDCLHSSMPLLNGIKYVATKWIRI